MRLERVEKPFIAGFDHRRRGRVGTHIAQPGVLTATDPPTVLVETRIVEWFATPAREDFLGLGKIDRVAPAVMEHRFREPLVGIVLDQGVHQSHGRIGRHRMAAFKLALKSAQERGGIGDRFKGFAACFGRLLFERQIKRR